MKRQRKARPVVQERKQQLLERERSNKSEAWANKQTTERKSYRTAFVYGVVFRIR